MGGLFMPAPKLQVKRFEFPINISKAYELPAHWVPFQVDEGREFIVVWAYRNGNA